SPVQIQDQVGSDGEARERFVNLGRVDGQGSFARRGQEPRLELPLTGGATPPKAQRKRPARGRPEAATPQETTEAAPTPAAPDGHATPRHVRGLPKRKTVLAQEVVRSARGSDEAAVVREPARIEARPGEAVALGGATHALDHVPVTLVLGAETLRARDLPD